MMALAACAGAVFSAAPALAQNPDSGSYQGLTAKAAADYKTAIAECNGSSGNAKKVCIEEARVARAQAAADAAAQYRNTPQNLGKARSDVAKAEYNLARAKCADSAVSDRNACLRDARSAQTAGSWCVNMTICRPLSGMWRARFL